MNVLILVLSILFFILSLYTFQNANHIKVSKNEKQAAYEEEYKEIQKIIVNLQIEKENLLKEIQKQKTIISDNYTQAKTIVDNQINLYKDNVNYASQQYFSTLEKEYSQAEEDFDNQIEILKNEATKMHNQISDLKQTLSAGMQAQLREQAKHDKINFYKIGISNDDILDIKSLNHFKTTFHNPAIINKLIWSFYCQKKVTEMCNRVLGTKAVCGIYKITNLDTQKCYIGQSVNIAERWKQHCKCGCDIDASSTNRLYQDMISTGIWNFSFELMEQCPKDELNKKEAFWIEMYQSDIYGLNSTKGNK